MGTRDSGTELYVRRVTTRAYIEADRAVAEGKEEEKRIRAQAYRSLKMGLVVAEALGGSDLFRARLRLLRALLHRLGMPTYIVNTEASEIRERMRERARTVPK